MKLGITFSKIWEKYLVAQFNLWRPSIYSRKMLSIKLNLQSVAQMKFSLTKMSNEKINEWRKNITWFNWINAYDLIKQINMIWVRLLHVFTLLLKLELYPYGKLTIQPLSQWPFYSKDNVYFAFGLYEFSFFLVWRCNSSLAHNSFKSSLAFALSFLLPETAITMLVIFS